MEDNLKVNDSVMDNKQKKKRKSFPVIISLIVLLCVTVFGILCGTGVIPVPVGNSQFVDIDTAKLIKNASNVQDEETLRQLLLLDMELDITVTNDIKVKEAFMVYGKKTLRGDATIAADFFGKFEQISIFDVQKGASVTMDGLVIDGNGLADGFSIAQNAELTYLKGTLQKVHQGIITNGTVTIEDIDLHTIGKYGINALFRSDVYLNGGKIYNSGTNLLYIDSMANVEIREGCELFASRSNLITNVGTLKVYGGSFSTSYHGIGIHNQGKLEMDYQGKTEGGMITISDTGAAAIIMDSNQDGYISDVHTSNIGKNAIWVSDLKARGGVTVENCIFEGSGMAYGNASALSLGGTATVKDVVIKDSTDDGIYLRKDSQFVLENISLENTNGMGIYVCGSKLDAKNITIKGAAFGVSLQKDGNFVANANIEGITVSEARRNNIQLYEGTKIRLKDAVLEKSIRTSVYIAKDTEAELDNVEIKGVTDPGLLCFAIREGAKATILGDTVITGATLRGIGMYQDSSLTMKSGIIKNITSSGSGAAILLEKGATFNMLGGTFTNNYSTVSGGAVYISHGATFNMKGGTISNNQSEKNGGGGVQLQGVMNFSGGTIKNNISGQYGAGINVAHSKTAKTNGKLNMTGGTISGNKATTVGGGILIASTSEANISGGTISNNSARGLDSLYGDGIYLEGKLTVSNKAYVEKDVITLATSSVALDIKGNTLSKHSASNPLLVGVARGTKEGKVVVKGDSEQAINSLLSHVASGSRAYTLCQNKKDTKTMTVSINKADMDMTGADKVYVNSFKELKEAVEMTTSKRYIIIGADIQFESNIAVPDGTTVYIRDDGQPRVFSRAEGYTSSYFTVYYGTGLHLVGTSYGNLKLDGTISGDAKAEKVSAFMDARGTTEIRNIAFENNVSLRPGKCGSFIYQECGETSIYSSTFTGGVASYGGAIYIGGGSLTLDDCIFKQNEAIERGGALFVAAGKADVYDTAYVKNVSKSGGAVYLDGGETSFVRKTNSNAIFSENIATGTALSGSNCKDGGGALYVQRGKVTSIDGYTFEENQGQDGGAIVANKYNDSKSGVIESLKNSYFYKNQAIKSTNGGGRGGAIYHRGLTSVVLKIENCTFGGSDENGSLGNIAESYGGAIWANRPFEIKGVGLFENNESSTAGGAVYMTDPYDYTISGQIFKNNHSVNGGAIYTNNANSNVVLEGSEFVSNTTTENGGAIYSKGLLTVSDTAFDQNTAKAGGAVYINSGTASFKENTKFVSNATTGSGGAITTYGKLELEDTSFINNASTASKDTYGGAIYIAKGNVSKLEGCTFTGNTAPDGGAIGANNTGYTAKITNGITNSKFNENKATNYRGGAIYYAAYESQAGTNKLVIDNCEFGRNEVKGSSGTPAGGAIWTNRTMEMKGNGVFEENSASNLGGAIYVTNGNTYNITGQTFKNNSAKDGGALYSNNASANVVLVDSKFESNTTTNNGGAIYSKGKLDVSDTAFDKNTAKAGGAVYIESGKATFKETANSGSSSFSGNTATGSGGAITTYGELLLEGTSFTNNASTASKDTYGGAIYIAKGNVSKLEGCTFTGNTAPDGGAIGANNTGSTAKITNGITNSKFNKNKATNYRGGAIYYGAYESQAGSNKLVIENCEFSGNEVATTSSSSAAGGAIWTNRTMEIKGNGLFEENSSSNRGGAIYATNGNQYNITGQTFKNNSAKEGGTVCNFNAGATFSITDSIIVSNSNTGSPIYSVGTTALSNAAFSGGNKEIALPNATSRAIISGKITDAVIVYKNADALVTVASTGIDQTSTISLTPSSYTVGAQVLDSENDNDAAKEALASAAKIIGVTQSGAKWWTITSEGKLNCSAIVSSDPAVADFTSLEAAISEMPTGAVIYVDANETIANTITIDKAITLKTSTEGVTLTRGNAAEMFNVTSNGSLTVEGAITLDGNKTAVSGTNSLIVNAGTLELGKGVVVKNASFESGNGGAVYSTGTLAVTDAAFQDNTAKAGGAVYINGGTASFEGTANSQSAIFSGNIASGTALSNGTSGDCVDGGGAIYVQRGKVTSIDGYTFTENKGQDGGAIVVNEYEIATKTDAAIESLKNCNFNKNQSIRNSNKTGGRGGAIYHRGLSTVTLEIENCTFANNTAKNAYGGAIWANRPFEIKGEGLFESNSTSYGGAIYVTSGNTYSITGQTFKNNSSAYIGGAICFNNANSKGIINASEFINNSAVDNGGAIYSIGKLDVSDTAFNQNTAKAGGAVYINGGTASFEGTANSETAIFSGNIASGKEFDGSNCKDGGGAIYVQSGTVTLIDGYTFEENKGQDGGAIVVNPSGAIQSLKNSYFDKNQAIKNGSKGGRGGAIYNRGSLSVTLEIENCTFVNNTAKNSEGGAIWANRNLVIKGEGLFENNSASNGGAILARDPYTYSITGQTFKNNTAAYGGGAICVYNATTIGVIDNSHFDSNSAVVGGAIYNAGTVTVYSYTNSTFTGNTSTSTKSSEVDNVTSGSTTIKGLYKTTNGTFTFKTESKPTE